MKVRRLLCIKDQMMIGCVATTKACHSEVIARLIVNDWTSACISKTAKETVEIINQKIVDKEKKNWYKKRSELQTCC
jgi:hypothetical protein